MIAGANTIITQEAPPDMRGRMLALTAVAFLGSTPIGGPITGWVADYVSVSWSLAYGGIITLVAAVFMFVWIWVKDIEHAYKYYEMILEIIKLLLKLYTFSNLKTFNQFNFKI